MEALYENSEKLLNNICNLIIFFFFNLYRLHSAI